MQKWLQGGWCNDRQDVGLREAVDRVGGSDKVEEEGHVCFKTKGTRALRKIHMVRMGHWVAVGGWSYGCR